MPRSASEIMLRSVTHHFFRLWCCQIWSVQIPFFFPPNVIIILFCQASCLCICSQIKGNQIGSKRWLNQISLFHTHPDISSKGCKLSEGSAGENWAWTNKDSPCKFLRCFINFWLGKGKLEKFTKHKSVLRVIRRLFYVALVAHGHYFKNYIKSKQRKEQSLALRFIPVKYANEIHIDL